MRLNLLSALPSYADRLSERAINNDILPQVMAGFTDSEPVLREATIKSMALFAPKLSIKSLGEVLRHFSRSVTDIEPGIRTNTVVCLGMIAKYYDETVFSHILCNFIIVLDKTQWFATCIFYCPARYIRSCSTSSFEGFGRFERCVFDLMLYLVTNDFYKITDCATKILPTLSFSLIDSDRSVREQTFATLGIYLKRLEEHSKQMVAILYLVLTIHLERY